MTSRLILLNDFHDVDLQKAWHCVFRGGSVIKPPPCTADRQYNGLVKRYGLASAELHKSCWLHNPRMKD